MLLQVFEGEVQGDHYFSFEEEMRQFIRDHKLNEDDYLIIR